MNRLLALALAPLFLAGAANAAPVLKSAIIVTSPIVTVGDMFDGADLYAEQPLFRAPAPGTTGKVSIRDIRVAAARIGLTDFQSTAGGAVTVARFGQPVDATELSAEIDDALRQRGFLDDGVKAKISFSMPLPHLTADSASVPVSLASFNYMAGNGAFSARFMISGRSDPVDIAGRADLVVAVPHLASSLGGGAIIRPEDVDMRDIPVRMADTGSFSTLDQVVGMQLKRPARAGMILKPGDIRQPVLVTRNEPVTIVYRAGPLTLTAKGQALADASRGETVQVLNLMSSKVLTTIASDPGLVTLAGPDMVASIDSKGGAQ